MKIRVYYEDTDCGNVVYYANYLKYFERVRTEFVRERGESLTEYMNNGILFVVAKVEVKYKFPARYDDVLDITTTVSEITKASFTMEYTVLRETDRKLCVSGMTKMACINTEGRPIRIPERLRSALSQP